jgi:1-aminocyclopropane-1-carboxylate deaminase/D-cysteine desulfhydrase-like pyridoxal-dependent ACC family enzyme
MPWPALSTDELRTRVARLPRVPLAHVPTPLEEVPRFAARVGDVRIFVKRDDCTGLLLGGNKARHNEFILGDATHAGANMFVWGAGVQSNNCRQTAAGCARLGLECRLYLSRGHYATEVQGNLLLDHLVGAKVEIVDAPIGAALDELLSARAEVFRAEGRKPYVWERAKVLPLAAVSYALGMAELADQCRAMDIKPSAVYVSSAGGTGAGLGLGRVVLGLDDWRVRSVCPMRWPWDVRAEMAATANRAAELLDLPHRLSAADVEVTEAYIAPAYGRASPAGREALHLLATTEAILLDPVYTAKAMAGLIDDIRQRRIAPGDTVVFVHTGGVPAIFAQREEVYPTPA